MEGEEPDPRFTLANERTYLAWNRTALALVGGGLAAAQLLHFDSEAVRLCVSLPPIALGGGLAAVSYRRWEANEQAMRLGKPLGDDHEVGIDRPDDDDPRHAAKDKGVRPL